MAYAPPLVLTLSAGQLLTEPLSTPVGGLLSSSYNTEGLFDQLLVRSGPAVIGNALADQPMAQLAFVDQAGNSLMIVSTPTRWYVFNPATSVWTDLQGGVPLGGSKLVPNTLDMFTMAGVQTVVGPFNGVDKVFTWQPGAANYTQQAAAPVGSAGAVAVDRVIVANLLNLPTRVKWCSVADATTWPAGAFADLRSKNPILACRTYDRNSAAIYTDGAQWMAIGQPGTDATAFGFVQQDNQPGPVGPAAITTGPKNAHFYFGTDFNLYQFDGNTASILAHTRFLLAGRINLNVVATASMTYFPATQELLVALPLDADAAPMHLLVYNFVTQQVNIWAMPAAITSLSTWLLNTQTVWSNMPDVVWSLQPDVPWASLGVTSAGIVASIGSGTTINLLNANTDTGTAIAFQWDYLLPVIPGQEYVFDMLEIIAVPMATPITVSVKTGDALDVLTTTVVNNNVSLANGMARVVQPLSKEIRGRVMVISLTGSLSIALTIRRLEARVRPRALAVA